MTNTAAHPSSASPWRLAERSRAMNASALRELLKLTEQPGMRSLAGGLPSPACFPVAALRAACEQVLANAPEAALQYGPSEGLGALRAQVAERLQAQGLQVDAAQVLITTGSQQGLDLAAKVLIDPGAWVAVEAPTYLGALQAFNPFGPRYLAWGQDADGPAPQPTQWQGEQGRPLAFAYLVPNFQNPTGLCMGAARRAALVAQARQHGVPLLEDNPYGDLWFEAPPPPPLATHWPEGVLHLGSFSKVLAPGLRLGYLAAPPALWPKLLQAKQAADLHSPSFNQWLVQALLASGLLQRHLPEVRAVYRRQALALDAALRQHMPAGCHWRRPEGGMFFWLRLPPGLDAQALLPAALARQVAYVPGTAFFAPGTETGADAARWLRLSFVTLPAAALAAAVADLAQVVGAAQAAAPAAPRPALAA